MTPDELEAIKTIAKSLSGTSIALVHLIIDLAPIIGNNEKDRLLKIIDDAFGEEEENAQKSNKSQTSD